MSVERDAVRLVDQSGHASAADQVPPAAIARASSGAGPNPEPAFEAAACPLCGSGAFSAIYRNCPDRRHWRPGLFDVVECRGCGLVRTSPRPTRESIGSYYPESYVCYGAGDEARGRLYAAFRWLVRLPYVLRHGSADPAHAPVGDANRLLDLGCGTGLYLEEMAERGWDPWGVEPDAATARVAVERLDLPADRILVGTGEDAEFPPQTFDLVTMVHVIEHLHDPRQVLGKVNGWLRPGGRVRIWAPNFGSLERRVFGRVWFGLDVPRHLFHFSPGTLGRMLEDAGFAVERVRPQYQVNTLAWSFAHVADAVRRRRRDFRESMALYYAFLPAAIALLALGTGGALEVTARKRGDGDGAAAS